MKTMQNVAIYLFFAGIGLSSCAVNRSASANFSADTKVAKEPTGVFVKKKDGEVVYFKTLELKHGAFLAPHLLADGKLKIKSSEIVAYQTADHFAISQDLLSEGKKSYVSKNTLPGFAMRLMKGKINLYCKQYYNGSAAIDEYFIQSGDNGAITLSSPETMKKIMSDNEQTISYLNEKNEKISWVEKIQTAAKMYNSYNAVTQN